MAQKFIVKGIWQLKADKENLGAYVTFEAFTPAGEKLAELITSKSFCGRWVRLPYGEGYRQTAGTMQAAYGTAYGIRKALRCMIEAADR